MPRLRQRPERKRNSDSEYGLSDYEQDNDDEEYCESEYKNEVESDSDEDVESDVGDDVEGGAESTEMSEVEEIELPIRVSTPKKAVKPKAKAEPKPEEVPSNVNRHIQTMPPEILRGVYAVIPSPRPKRGLDQSLPPIHKIEDIFDDLVSKAESHGFEKFIKRIGDRKLRVATMCSGTEAPLLALDMIAESKATRSCRTTAI